MLDSKPYPSPQGHKGMRCVYCLLGTLCLGDTVNKPYAKRNDSGYKCSDWRGVLRMSEGDQGCLLSDFSAES